MFNDKMNELKHFISNNMKCFLIYPDLLASIAAIEKDVSNSKISPQFAYYEALGYFIAAYEENSQPHIVLPKVLFNIFKIPPEELQFIVLFSKVKEVLPLELIETIRTCLHNLNKI